jgi:anti-sigma factor RsiW
VTSELEQLSCQELVELVTSYLDGGLSDAERTDFERHLETCDGCHEYVEQMRQTIALTSGARRPALTPEIEQGLLVAFRSWKAT